MPVDSELSLEALLGSAVEMPLRPADADAEKPDAAEPVVAEPAASERSIGLAMLLGVADAQEDDYSQASVLREKEEASLPTTEATRDGFVDDLSALLGEVDTVESESTFEESENDGADDWLQNLAAMVAEAPRGADEPVAPDGKDAPLSGGARLSGAPADGRASHTLRSRYADARAFRTEPIVADEPASDAEPAVVDKGAAGAEPVMSGEDAAGVKPVAAQSATALAVVRNPVLPAPAGGRPAQGEDMSRYREPQQPREGQPGRGSVQERRPAKVSGYEASPSAQAEDVGSPPKSPVSSASARSAAEAPMPAPEKPVPASAPSASVAAKPVSVSASSLPKPSPAASITVSAPAGVRAVATSETTVSDRAASNDSFVPVETSAPASAGGPAVTHAAGHPVRRKANQDGRVSTRWFVVCGLLLALMVASTCFAVWTTGEQGEAAPVDSPESNELAFGYTALDSNGLPREVRERVEFDSDGFAESSSLSVQAENDEAAALLLADAQMQFGSAWSGGSVVNSAAVFTVDVRNQHVDRDAYTALVMENTTDAHLVDPTPASDSSPDSVS